MSENEVLVIDTSDRRWAERLVYALIANASDSGVRAYLYDMSFGDAQKALRSLLPPKSEEVFVVQRFEAGGWKDHHGASSSSLEEALEQRDTCPWVRNQPHRIVRRTVEVVG